MNTTAAYRMSTIITERPSVPRRRTFHPVDWPSFKQDWQQARGSVSLSSSYIASEFIDDDDDDEEEEKAVDASYGPVEAIKRIFTVFPVRDAAWITAMAFILGSISFTVASVLTILPLLFPPLEFPGRKEVAFPAALTIGSACFFTGGNLATFGAFNVNRGPIPDDQSLDKAKSHGHQRPPSYNPALLGSEEWVWFPGWTEFRSKYLSNPAFCGGLIAMFGGYILSSSTIIGFPGVLDEKAPDFIHQLNRFVMTPLIIGASLLGTGAFVLTLVVQEKWYKPELANVAWHSSFWNVAAAAWLVASAALTILRPDQELNSAIASNVSSLAFDVAASLQLYMLMQHYPRHRSD